MAKYVVEISDELGVEVDFPPNASAPLDIDFDFEATTEDELRKLVVELGFDAAEMDPTDNLHTRYGIPVTRDGERVGKCTVSLWIRPPLTDRPVNPPIELVERLRDEARAARAEAARQDAHAIAVEWAQGVGRPVALEDGKVVER